MINFTSFIFPSQHYKICCRMVSFMQYSKKASSIKTEDLADLSESQVDEVGKKLSTSDEATVESYKGSANPGGGSLRNVQRRCH